jgi:hypothetical protein
LQFVALTGMHLRFALLRSIAGKQYGAVAQLVRAEDS